MSGLVCIIIANHHHHYMLSMALGKLIVVGVDSIVCLCACVFVCVGLAAPGNTSVKVPQLS